MYFKSIKGLRKRNEPAFAAALHNMREELISDHGGTLPRNASRR